MISAQVASKMKGCLVSFIAIFLVISLEMMEGAEGKPQPGPEPEPAPEPAPGWRTCGKCGGGNSIMECIPGSLYAFICCCHTMSG